MRGRSFSVGFALLVSLTASAALPSAGWNTKEIEALEKCPCDKPSLCLPVRRTPSFEVFAFSPSKGTNWRYYDYDTLTTIAWNLDKELLCHAHAHDVKIVIGHNFDDVSQLCNPTARQAWINETYDKIVENYADGVNIDTEAGMSGQVAKCQTLLVQELRARLSASKFTEYAQISFDIPWSPHGIDQRYYDWKGLADAADLLFVMSYDMRSQIYYQCIAGANSPLALVDKGLEEYIVGYDIPPSKLVLGLPWYAYVYPCESLADDICHIQAVPFRGAPCSDAAGRQIDYADVQKLLADAKNPVEQHWENISATPFLTVNGTTQVWYDNDRSLGLKYDLAKQRRLLGVGMWHVDALDYLGKEHPVIATAKMWQTLRQAVPTPRMAYH
ncbi:unnamed protein product [Aphanomyces euteiches]|uniref:GH18 domain-containing protein n=1 Tax=Aphanomyces euteiches TaxID=100861 RepID=A0A6G0XB71_9STRA|nr:hypothetical protein Ae201684_006571 [Aphanomyces euteiches]KAH9090983.1 hypothetical protein Ae201684P_006385 [Aphanomyces euteiches]KAH9139969.1 hypothetical protein AeRB84_015744 [Aphanomyces euteiches]KAH9140289.1 hypothetical protein AeRB84_015458 [Aphanomyces euteiches]KAH9140482.1 hypothetical protein AeRB84_015293 [Aphanomyces euteiches]